MSHSTPRLINVVKFGCLIMLATCIVSQNATAGRDAGPCTGLAPPCPSDSHAQCDTTGHWTCKRTRGPTLDPRLICTGPYKQPKPNLTCKPRQIPVCRPDGIWSCQ